MFYYLHFYLLAFGILEKELYPGFPIVRGAFKLRELVSPQYGLQGKDEKTRQRGFNNEHNRLHDQEMSF